MAVSRCICWLEHGIKYGYHHSGVWQFIIVLKKVSYSRNANIQRCPIWISIYFDEKLSEDVSEPKCC